MEPCLVAISRHNSVVNAGLVLGIEDVPHVFLFQTENIDFRKFQIEFRNTVNPSLCNLMLPSSTYILSAMSLRKKAY